MKRHILLVGLTLALTLMIIAGCGDDEECPTCPPASVQELILYGYTTVDGSDLYMHAYLFAVDGGIPAVDSVKFNGELCETRTMYDAVSIVAANYEGNAGTLSSGDNVSAVVYTPSGTGTATVSLLAIPGDLPVGFNHPVESPYDTVAIGESITVSWSPVTNADWYGVNVYYSYDSAGTHDSWTEWSALTTTSVSIPESLVAFNGYFSISVNPMTGPQPTQTGNVTGGVVKGTFNSATYEHLNIYVGTGDAWPSSVEPPHEEPSPLALMRLMHGF